MRKQRLSSVGSSFSSSPLDFQRYVGLSLGGEFSDRTSVVVLDYFPKQPRIYVSRLSEKIKTQKSHNSNEALVDILDALAENLVSITADAPLSLPICMTCNLECPGQDRCPLPEVIWQKKFALAHDRKLSAYSQRCGELFVTGTLEEKIDIGHAMGANSAPLLARLRYIRRRVKANWCETFPRVSLWRIGRGLGVSKTHLRSYKQSADGKTSRALILETLHNKAGMFFYQADHKILSENPYAFEALVCALVGLAEAMGQCEARPIGFPESEVWPKIPKNTWIKSFTPVQI